MSHSIYLEFKINNFNHKEFLKMENKGNENLILEAETICPIDDEIAIKGSMAESNKISHTEKYSDKEKLIKAVKDGWAEIDEFFSS
jgi:hypothetical protein